MAGSGLRALLHLHRSRVLQSSFFLLPVQPTSTCLLRGLSINNPRHLVLRPPAISENESLLENLDLMGVDVKTARLRQPGIFRKSITNEKGLAQFLESKGASPTVIASIISRYPRAITRSLQHLERRWELWRNIFPMDSEIVSIVDRSPESFFRSSDNENLEKNITFLTSLGLNSKHLHRLLTTAPRTFSNSLELNKQRVDCLQEICAELGGNDPKQFAKAIISRNLYILIKSTTRVKNNIDILSTSLKLCNSELLAFLQGSGAEILQLSNECLKKNLESHQEKLVSLGCQKADMKNLIISYPMLLYFRLDKLSSKLDCLLKGGVTIKQILQKPKVLDYSTQNLTGRLEELKRVQYDFEKYGISILNCSQKRFVAKMEKLEEDE
ncbi:transcription termination factor 1b, mitochondrial [Genypterus blacodes]|uniref:transcription termination factor 1b, mitochondrial n=1 Tax=Genypterus blacodes TaxID=154954 RepID=UPI003F75C4A6